MMRFGTLVALLFSLLISANAAANQPLQFATQLNPEKHLLMIRHALAPGIGDPENFQLEDCSTQRNLSSEGKAQAVQIGLLLQQ